MFVKDLMGNHVANAVAPAILAATATQADPIFVAPFKCVVTGVAVVPQAAVTGDDTNRRNLNVLNAGSDGSGTTEVANLDLATGVDLVAGDRKAIPLNTTYASGVEMAEGDVLMLSSEKVSSGVACPAMLVEVKFRGNGV